MTYDAAGQLDSIFDGGEALFAPAADPAPGPAAAPEADGKADGSSDPNSSPSDPTNDTDSSVPASSDTNDAASQDDATSAKSTEAAERSEGANAGAPIAGTALGVGGDSLSEDSENSPLAQLVETLKSPNGPPVDESGGPLIALAGAPAVVTVPTYSRGPDDLQIIRIGGTAAGSYDRFNVTGAASFDGTVQLQLVNGFVPAAGNSFTIFTWGTHSGQFSHWLNTTGVPGHPDLAFVPTYSGDPGSLTLTVVSTAIVIPFVQNALTSGLTALGNVGSLLNGVGAFAQDIPLIGDPVSGFVDMGNAVLQTVRNEIQSLWNSLTKESEVTSEIQSWNNSTFGIFTVKVNGVLGHYGIPLVDPISWDVSLEISPTTVNRLLADVTGAVFGAVFNPDPTVQVTSALDLNFSFGFDATLSSFYVSIHSLTAKAEVDVSGLSGFNLNTSVASMAVTDGFVDLAASVTAVPDESILTDGKITYATLSSLGVGTVADAFNLEKAGTLSASLTLAGSLNLGPVLQYTGTHTALIESADLFNGQDPDLTLKLVGTLTFLNQNLAGTFIFRKTATETVVEASGVTLSLTLGPSDIRVLRLRDGSGLFLLLDDDLAGTASLTVDDGPAIPGFDIAGTTLNLAFNTSDQAVPSINGTPVNLPAGDYYRVSGFAQVSLAVPPITLTGNFAFEPRDTDSNPANGDEEVRVGVADLTFAFSVGGLDLLSVTNGSGAFVITDDGLAGVATADVGLDVEALSLGGTFQVVVNTTNAAVTARDLEVNGTTVRLSLDNATLVDLPVGPYLRVSGDDVELDIQGVGLSGSFTFEKRQTADADEVITVAASNVTFDLGSQANDLVNVTITSGAFIITDDGIAGTASATIAVGVSSISLAGTFTVLVNTNESAAVNETVSVGGSNVVINVPIGPYLRVSGTGVSLTILGAHLNGNFSFEQKNTAGGAQLVTVTASNVSLTFGATNFISATNGQGVFLITDGGWAGQGSININVSALGGSFTQPVTWDFNETGGPIDDQILPPGGSGGGEGAEPQFAPASPPNPLDDFNLPSGPYNRFSTHGAVPLTINVGGVPQGLTAALVLTLVDAPAPTADYVTVGVSEFSASLGSGSLGLAVSGGTGAFVILDAGVAGDVTVDTATLSGAGVLGVTASELRFRFNTTAGNVGSPNPIVVSVSDNSADDVSIQFIDQPNYLAIEGAAEITGLTGAVTLGGVFAFEKARVDTNGDAVLEDVFKVGATGLHFALKAGTLSVASFEHGVGAFVVTPGGIAGVAELDFEVGIVGMAGDIKLEVNTTSTAVNTSVVVDGAPVFINIADTHVVRVCVVGHLLLGSVALPLNFIVEVDTGTSSVTFKQKDPPHTVLVSISSTGAITTGLSFTDFARPGPFEFVSMLRQLLVWIDTFRGSDLFDLTIPFTDGTTLGDAFDWTQLFIDSIWSNLISIELQSASLRTINPITGLPTTNSGTLINARFKIQIGSEAPVEIAVAGAWANVNALVTLFNASLPGSLVGRIEARINHDDQFVIALLPSEIAAGRGLKLVDLNGEAEGLGFGPADSTYGDLNDVTPEQVGLETSRYDVEDFFDAVRQAVAPLAPPVVYNAAQRVYTFSVDESATYNLDVPFAFGADFGPIASAALSGLLHLAAEVGFTFTLGFDLGAREVPRILTSTFVPTPANGRISADAHFQVLLNDDVSFLNLTLPKSYTDGTDALDPVANASIEDLAKDLNRVFHETFHGPDRLDQLLIAQKAGSGLAISALHEDRDDDGHLDVDEDLNDNGIRDGGEADVDGDGHLDTVAEDLNLDGNLDRQLGLINRVVIRSNVYDTFATELGFGVEVEDLDGNQLTINDRYFTSSSNSTIRGLFIDNVELSASLTVTTPVPIAGSLRFGFVEISTSGGLLGTLDDQGNPNPLEASVGLQNATTGETRFYLSDLFNSLSSLNIGNMIHGPDFSGSFLAKLDNISVGGLGFSFPLGSNPEVSIFIPDINDLDYNPDPYDGTNTGLFLTYPDLGGLQNFTSLSFTQIIKALKIIADNLSQLSAFSFLDERLPLIDISINDMVDYAAKFAELIDAAAGGGSQSLQQAIAELETQIEQLFDLNPNVLTVSLDENGMPAASLVTAGGTNGGANSTVTINPNGDNNSFTVRTTTNANAGDLNGSIIRIVGDSAVTGTNATAEWDSRTKVLTLHINGGTTTTNAIIAAINALASSPWTAALATPDNGVGGNTGAGTLTTAALKFHFIFEAAYANSLPFELDLRKLVSDLAGDDNVARAFLEAATTLIQISGSGQLTVSASAALTLDFGLDVTNPATVRPFFYDTTGVELLAKVLGTNIEIEASLGSVFGIWIKDATVTIDADGDPETDAGDGDRGANFRLGLKDNNGDGRHYFTENWFDADNIDLHLQGGVRATLPIFAPFESTPLDGDSDDNGDGYPDNYLVIDIPDLVRLFISEAVSTEATGSTATIPFGGTNNDIVVNSTLHSNYDIVFLDTLGGGGANASFDIPNNRLTVNIDAGNTTALTARNAIRSVASFNLTALTADDDGLDGSSSNNGGGKLEKLQLITPDFGALFEGLDFCDIIASQTGLLLDGLDSLLGSIQDGLNAIVLNQSLPLIGDGLAGAANFIEDFRNGLLASLRKEVDEAGGNGLTAVENAIKKAFWNTIGPDGLNLLVDADTGAPLDPSLGYSQLDVVLDCDNGLTVNLRLRKEAALLDTTVAFDIGVPGFGLQVDGGVQVKVGFDLKFGFGISPEDGFYFNSSAPADDPELRVFFEATIPSLHVGGQLLFLQLDVMDDAEDPSAFVGEFVVDLKDPSGDGKLTFAEMTSGGTEFSDILSANLQADANVNLDLAASFGGNTAFPRVLAEFHLAWHFDIINGAEDPQVSFTDIYLDLGTFLSDFLGPILTEIRKVTEPLQPLIDVVTARLPVLSDLAGETVTLLTLAEVFGLLEPSTVDFINSVLEVVELINSLEGLGEGSILIPFGAFSLLEDNNGDRRSVAVLQEAADLTGDALQSAIDNAGGPGTSETYQHQVSGFASDVGSLSNFSIPIFDNPAELFNLFIGEPVRLVEWRMPTFKFEFTYTQKIPIYPPLYAQFGGSIGATIDIGFGYDTFGIQKFIESEDKNPIDLLDGFYVIDFDASGHERPELTLTGEIFAGASIDLVIVSVGVNGGITATIEFDLNDVNDDGKVRVSEIIANAQQDPRCIFDIHGEIGLFLEAFLKVDLFFFSFEKTWRFAEITLFEFTITCPEPVLASKDGSGVLTLHVGADASKREEIDTSDNSETFIVKQLEGDQVEVQWSSWKQTYSGVTKILVRDAGAGNDVIDTRGVKVPVEIHGGAGNDTIYLSDAAGSVAYGDEGNDVITPSTANTATGVVIHGGAGNDELAAGSVAITIYGDAGNDTIAGSPEGDLLYGDDGTGTSSDGADTIDGGDGPDEIHGGLGNDQIEGGADDDWILGDGGNDILRGSRGDDIIEGGDDDDKLYGSSGNDLLVGGRGNDWVNGHGGIDLLIGEYFTTINGLALNTANLGSIRAALAAIPASGVTVNGLTGADVNNPTPITGNDLLIGGGNIDVLFGGPGADFLYGGNFLNTGETDVIEEDGNDFFDGGPGNDTIFGDDAMGQTGDRDTGIAIKGGIFFDLNKNGLRDEDETGFGGVLVELYRNDGVKIADTETESDGAYSFTGLDPDLYYLIFESVPGMNFITRLAGGAANAEAASNDSDVYEVAPPPGRVIGQTPDFTLTFDETESAVTAGYEGDPIVSISNISVEEGDSGQTQATFTVTLSGPQVFVTTLSYATADGNDLVHPERNAIEANGDYLATSGVLQFGPGDISKTITVFLNGDTTYEEHQQFRLLLSNPSAGIQLPTAPITTALATIINDDPIPAISIADYVPPSTLLEDGTRIYTVGEGDPATFVVTLSNPSQYTIKVRYLVDSPYTFAGLDPENPARPFPLFADGDFIIPATTTVTFLPGETRKTITVPLVDDAGNPIDEYDEHFFVDLYNPEYARIEDGRGYGIVPDDDPAVAVSIAPLTPIGGPFRTEVAEGTGSSLTTVPIVVSLSKVSNKEVKVTWATSPGTAVEAVYSVDKANGTALEDYVAFPQPSTPDADLQLVFAPGQISKTIYVTINGDSFVEGDEMFFVNLISADNAVIAEHPPAQSNHVTIVIKDDDTTTGGDPGPWAIRFSQANYTVAEPASGTVFVPITLLRAPGSSHAIAVFYTTDGTATAGADYDGYFRLLVNFADNELSRTVYIAVHADTDSEGDETVLLSLRNPTGGPVRGSPDTAVLTITDEDVPNITLDSPGFLVFDPELFIIRFEPGIVEGNPTLQSSTTFTINLDEPAPPGGVFVTWETFSLTARASSDFTAATGVAFIAPTTTSTTFSVTVTQDTVPELTERFAVRLKNPVRANLAPEDSVVLTPIFDDDLKDVIGTVFYDTNDNGFLDLGENGIEDVDVTISWMQYGVQQSVTVSTQPDGTYSAPVALGPVTISVDGQTVKSPYQKAFGPLSLLLWSGEYSTTTDNEVQVEEFDGIIGLSPFAPVGYKNSFSLTTPEGADDVGRGGTDDTIFGGPGDDLIDAGAGDDHVVGGHWQTATDSNMPVNNAAYNAIITIVDEDTGLLPGKSLPSVYAAGPVFAITPELFAGVIKGQIWKETDTNHLQLNPGLIPEPLFTGEVMVQLLDGTGNVVNAVVTTNGLYAFDNLYVDPANPSAESHYIIQFDLPSGYTFTEPNTLDANPNEDLSPIDSDAELVNRTRKIALTFSDPAENDIDAGVISSTAIPTANGLSFEFTRGSYSVYEKDGFVVITIVRGTSYADQSVLLRTSDGTGPEGALSSPAATKNYTATTKLLYFPVGETIATVQIPIFNRHLGLCDFRYFSLTLHDPTGRRLDDATVYIVGEGNATISDDDTILAGSDWDIVLGDSANIPGYAVTALYAQIGAPEKLGNIKRYGGPGDDVIFGGGGTDYLDGQLGDDILEGGDTVDIVVGGLGNDQIVVGQGNDDVQGDHGTDTLISRRPVPGITLTPTTLTHHRSDWSVLNVHTMHDQFEIARLFGDSQDNTFNLESWNSTAFVSGGIGDDTLSVANDTNMILRDATIFERLLYLTLYNFAKDASLSLATNSTYHLASLENVRLSGGGGGNANAFDASSYSRPVTFVDDAGNDTFIGGSAGDRFVFYADSPLGLDTITGNGGPDTITFVDDYLGLATLANVTIDLDLHIAQIVNANLSLILTDDFENATGGNGDDVLKGNGLDNVLQGGPGNDTLQGRGGDEIYAFDTDNPWGTETVIEDVGGGHDTLDFSGTTGRSISINLGVTTAQVVNLNLTLLVQSSGGGEGEIEHLIGGSRSDTLRGNSFNNYIQGRAGDDLLDGKSGDDQLDGGTGDDTLIGGTGTDTIAEQGNTSFTLTDTSLTRGTGEADSLDGIEVAHLTGGSGPNTFNLTGWTGTGSLDGGDSPGVPRIDTVIVSADANFTLTAGLLTVSTMLAPITLVSIDAAVLTDGPGSHTLDAAGFAGTTILTGNDGDDILIGGAGIDILRGGLGKDKLTGNRGNDVLDGGADFDMVLESLAGASWKVDFVVQNNSLVIVQRDPSPFPIDDTITEFDALAAIESLDLTGSAQDDSFDISSWTAGAVTLHGGAGVNILIGTIPDPDDDPEPDPVTVTLTNADITFTGAFGTIQFDNIQIAVITATAGDDTIDASGFTGGARLNGGDGDDTLVGGPGINILDGGDGDDVFIYQPDGALDLDGVIGGAGIDTLDFSAFAAGITLNLSLLGVGQLVVPGELQILFTSNSVPLADEIENVIGGSGADSITGNSLNNTLTGGAGADTLDGQGGTDTLEETSNAASIILTNGSLNIGGVIDTHASIEIVRLTGGAGNNTIDASAFNRSTVLDGGAGDDILIGGTSADILIGGAGNDTLRGGTGDDQYRFDVDLLLGRDTVVELAGAANGNDTLDFSTTTGVAITVELGNAGPQVVHATNLQLTLSANNSVENVIGGDQDDVIKGNALDNIFLGGRGDDTLSGGGGFDRIGEIRDADFVLTNSSLAVTEAGVTETDALDDIDSVVLAGGASDNLIDASAFTAGAVSISGLAGNDTLLGSYGNDVLRGGDGDDTVFGGGGADDIRGDAGNDFLGGSGAVDTTVGPDGDDTLRGGTGNDTFIFDQSFDQGTDTVIEFVGQGYADFLQGVGLGGIVIDLSLAGTQVIGPNLSIIVGGDLGAIEDSFP